MKIITKPIMVDPIPSKTDIGRIQYLERVYETADALEVWLDDNVGTSSDWPVEIKADEDGAIMLTKLLTDLKHALMPLRSALQSPKQC